MFYFEILCKYGNINKYVYVWKLYILYECYNY